MVLAAAHMPKISRIDEIANLKTTTPLTQGPNREQRRAEKKKK